MRRAILAALALAGGVAAPASAQQPPPVATLAGVKSFEAAVTGPTGEPIGRVRLSSGENATVLRIVIQPGGLTPGWHGLYLHETGDCSSAPAASGHDHHGGEHGLLNPAGPHDGNLPNLFVAPDGSAQAEVSTQVIAGLGHDAPIRAALAIHAREDDHLTPPDGRMGERVACAAIR